MNMYKKLLSNLPFNPSLVNQLTFYSQRLKKESSVRRIGIIFITLSMIVQFVSVISPAQSSLAASGNDIISGGFDNKDQAFLHCLNNAEDFSAILLYHGVTCDSLHAGEIRNISSGSSGGRLLSMGRHPQGFQGEVKLNIPGARSELYMRPLDSWGRANYRVIYVRNAWGLPVMIMFNCGNIVTDGQMFPPPPVINNPTGWLDGANCDNVWGWAKDDDDPNTSIGVHLYFDGPLGQSTKSWDIGQANQSSPDIQPGNHKFSVNLNTAPFDFKDGRTHTIYAYGINIGSGGNVELSGNPKTFGPCNAPPPPSLKCTVPGKESFDQSDTKNCFDDVCPKKEGIQNSTTECDVCPDTPNIQETTDLCDVCLYKNGVQLKEKDCDVCSNISGVQTVIQECDVCPNIPGEQSSAQECKSCSKSVNIDDTVACIDLAKKASNITTNTPDANGTTAKSNDIIKYTLSASNAGKIDSDSFSIKESIGDILDYADVVDLHGGSWDKKTNEVTWTSATIKPGESVEHFLTVKIKNPIPKTPVSSSDNNRMDLVMTNVYGNAVNIKLPASTAKAIEITTTKLPNTGPGASLLIGFVITSIIGYFFARSRLLTTELSFVREDYLGTSGGTN